jgi:aminoglycoside phosphotransferase (APT) family kinase protein
MREPGPLLASGRDADIFEYGPGLVLRRARTGRSLAHEARVMEYARAQGFPVPAVEELSHDGADMVMERLDGMDMVAVLAKRPWTVTTKGRVLAELHHRLHEIDAPVWLSPSPVGPGDRLLHLDLHPLNVMITSKGPMVIDWTGACGGEPQVDVALAWVLLTAGAIPGGRLVSRVLGAGRALLVHAFLASFDRTDVARHLEDVVAWKVSDPHMSAGEQARMWDLVRKESPRR